MQLESSLFCWDYGLDGLDRFGVGCVQGPKKIHWSSAGAEAGRVTQSALYIDFCGGYGGLSWVAQDEATEERGGKGAACAMG